MKTKPAIHPWRYEWKPQGKMLYRCAVFKTTASEQLIALDASPAGIAELRDQICAALEKITGCETHIERSMADAILRAIGLKGRGK